ncbi:hypothetical protein NBO_1183g0001 [Nosema bombycis CQ1]|uniref:Uncharacterized protein n=1 Tax=Nosema bombycis (strain CQ1 / CVCC 102059) TaxID=578461 RepID=R0MFC1_NOSB1|nr:hypothetical protein NBO_1183g0001 [Nosema bombycis CQ1]|eukprot:EOB11438.1 hypothetical protein NBO_1183g0001 [Nosema bombycis CQ1]
MIFTFLMTVLNVLASDQNDFLPIDEVQADFLDNTPPNLNGDFLITGERDKIEPVNTNSLWRFVLLKETLNETVVFNDELLEDNRKKLDIRNFTSNENFMFYVLNYNKESKDVHDIFVKKFITNILVNIYNPVTYEWVKNYVKYFVSKQETYQNIRSVNNNIINLITEDFSYEWALTKTLYNDEKTVNLLELLFCDEKIKNFHSPKAYISAVSSFLKAKDTLLDLSVVYQEICKFLKTIPQANIYYYEFCGVSTHFFGLLSVYKSYKAYLAGTSVFSRNVILSMKNLQESLVTLYYCTRLVANSERYNFYFLSFELDDLFIISLQLISGKPALTFKKAFECINMVRTTIKNQIITPRTTRFFNYFRTYILPISLYSERYIDEMHNMLSSNGVITVINDFELFYDIKDCHKLAMFLATE